MLHLTAADLAWLAVIAGVGIGFWLPILIAVCRQVDRPGIVVLCTVLGLGTGGVMWFAALLAAFMLPRRVTQPVPPGGPATWRP